MIKKQSEAHKYGIWLGILTLLFMAGQFIWLQYNKLQPYWDESRHLTIALHYFRFYPITSFSVYGPLYYLLSAISAFIFGPDRTGFTLVNSFFIPVLLFFTFKMGEALSGKRVGIAAAVLVSLYPLMYGMSRMFMLEFALASVAAMSGYFTLKCLKFKSIYDGVCLGTSFALGMLIKPSYTLFIVVPIIYLFIAGMFKNRKMAFQYMIYIAILGFAIPAIWNIHNDTVSSLSHQLRTDSFFRMSEFLIINIKNIFTFYVQMLSLQLGFAGLWLFIGALVLLVFIGNNKVKAYTFLMVGFLFPAICHYAYRDYPRYMLPSLPVIALFCSMLLEVTHWKKLLRVIFCILLFLLLPLYFINSFENKAIQSLPLLSPTAYWTVQAANPRSYPIDDLLDYVESEDKKGGGTIGVFVDTNFVNNETIGYYAYLRQTPYKIVRCVDEIRREYFTLDYIITLRNQRSWHWEWREFVVTSINDLLVKEYSHQYELVKTYNIPYRNEMYLYKKVSQLK